jgi:hypothetical protein
MNYRPLKEIGPDDKIQPNILYLYGTDFMSTEDVQSYFERFGKLDIKWINDSSCSIQFESDE